MAKTCFYCGKELAPGERCTCRGTSSRVASGTPSGASAQTSNTQAKTEKTESNEHKKTEKHEKKTKQVWERATTGTPDTPYGNSATGKGKVTFSSFITKVRSLFPSFSKTLRPIMSYIWHPVTTIQNRSQVVPIGKMIVINTLFATLTSLMVLFTNRTNSPFLGMLISLMFGKTDLFSAHPLTAFFTISAILWASVLILAGIFVVTSRLVNRKLSFLRALDTISMSSIYLCFADILVFFSVLLGTHGSVTLIFVALVIMGIAHFVSLKQDLTLSDNAAFNMLVISYLLFYTLAQLGLGIIIRLVTWF